MVLPEEQFPKFLGADVLRHRIISAVTIKLTVIVARVGEKMSKRSKVIFATATILAVVVAFAAVTVYMQHINADQRANEKAGLESPSASPTYSGETQDANVLAIGRKYVEEKYGSDYFVNSVGPAGYSEVGPNGTVNYDFPTATFRVPADMQKPGLLVYVMVNPQTGEIVKTWTSWSKSLPFTSPTQ